MIVYDANKEICAMCANLGIPAKPVLPNMAYFVAVDRFADGAYLYNDELFAIDDVCEMCDNPNSGNLSISAACETLSAHGYGACVEEFDLPNILLSIVNQ